MPNYYDHFAADNPFTMSGVNVELDKLDAQIKTNTDGIAAISFNPAVLPAQVRLSLSSSLPVPVADVTAATTIYLHPYLGQTLPLYDGANWVARTLSAAVSLSVPATTSTVYDVFVYWNGSAITLEAVAWSSATARATALTTQDGIYVKNGETTKRYVGSFRTTAVSGQCEDSESKRFLWNLYNAQPRSLIAVETTSSYTYTTGTWRQARADTTNQVEVLIGLSLSPVEVGIVAPAIAASATVGAQVGVGVDSTTVNSAQRNSISITHLAPATADYKGYPGIGYHYLAWIENGGGDGTVDWYPGYSSTKSGMIGVMQA